MKPNTRLLFAVVWILLLVIAQACAPETAEPSKIDTLTEPQRLTGLDSLIPELMDSGAVTGLSMAIAGEGGTVWARGFGVRSAETGEPVDENTVFEAASLSKPVFAYAVLQLVDEGIIDLDTPLHEYWDYEFVPGDERYKLITARMVLTHSPGFPNWRPDDGELTIDLEPGSEFSYSGEGFGYLQLTVMQITSEPLQEFVEKRVFEPLSMTNSSYIWEERFESNFTVPHNSDGEAQEKRKPERGRGHAAATLHTTATDFARFLTAALTGALLSDSTAVAMLTPQIEVDSGVTWGLGIGLQDNELGRGAWHWGDNFGYKAYTLAYPESGVGVIWFTNSDNGHAILSSLLDHTVGGEHPAVAWLDYEQYNSPRRATRGALWETIEANGVEAGIEGYHELKRTQPPEAFDEFVLNTLGYRLLRAERFDDAIAIFQLNIEEYPDAWNPYDSLGEAYMRAGDLETAIESYEKSLELNPDNTNGKAMLARIRAQLGG